VNKNFVLFVFLALFIAVSVFWAIRFTKEDLIKSPPDIESSGVEGSDEEISFDIPDGWIKYESEKLGISFYYHPEMDMSENEDGSVRFLVIGPSQVYGTEVYDGIILSFSEGTFLEENLEVYVNNLYLQKLNDPIYEEISQPKEINIKGKRGLIFVESALGTFTNIYLPLETNRFLQISYLLEDPENQGFEEMLEILFSSIVFL
jgi:hypothetical protein